MIVALYRAFAIVGGLVLAWVITLVGAEIISSLFAPAFEGVDWPVWFPTTPIIVAALALWFPLTRVILRIGRRGGQEHP